MLFRLWQITDNKLQFEVYNKLGLKAKLRLPRTRVSDGDWHHLLIEIKSMKDVKDIKYMAVIYLDYGMYQVTYFGDISAFQSVSSDQIVDVELHNYIQNWKCHGTPEHLLLGIIVFGLVSHHIVVYVGWTGKSGQSAKSMYRHLKMD